MVWAFWLSASQRLAYTFLPTNENVLAATSDEMSADNTDFDEAELARQRVEEDDAPEKFCNLATFWFSGVIIDLAYIVMLSAAEDLLKGHHELPTSIILVAGIVPLTILKFTAPFFMDRIAYRTRVILICGSYPVSLVIVALAENVWVRLFGVVITSFGTGLGEITYLSLCAHYKRSAISAYSSGLGLSSVLGAFSYLALTAWIGLESWIALLLYSPLPLIQYYMYTAVLIKPDSVLNSHLGESKSKEMTDMSNVGDVERDDKNLVKKSSLLTAEEKIKVVIHLLPRYMLWLFLVYFAEYSINQAVLPVVTFDDGPLPDLQTHYVYYYTIYDVGVWLSRSSIAFIKIRKFWALSFLQVVNFVVLVTVAYWQWIPSVWIVFPVCLWVGLLGGGVFVNAFYFMAESLGDREREFALGVGTAADAAGVCVAAVTGMFLEPWLDRACLMNSGRAQCLARAAE